MPQTSDSSYTAVTRHRRPFSTTGRHAVMFDEEIEHVSLNDGIHAFGSTSTSWETDCLSDDELPLARHLAVVAPLLEEGELDSDAVVASPTGNSSVAANTATERRRREEGWSDLGLDQFAAFSIQNSRLLSNSRSGASNNGPSAASNSGGSGTPSA
jgi:hypothetical protein